MHKLGKNKLRACQMKKRRTDALPRCLKIVKHPDQEGGFRLIRREVSMRPRPQRIIAARLNSLSSELESSHQ